MVKVWTTEKKSAVFLENDRKKIPLFLENGGRIFFSAVFGKILEKIKKMSFSR